MVLSELRISRSHAMPSALAVIASMCVAVPVFANSAAMLVTSRQVAAGTTASVHYDHGLRTVYLGGAAGGHVDSDSIATVTFNRAADLVGKPLAMVRPYRAALRTSLGSASLGAFSMSLGALPSSMPVASSLMTSGFGMREHPQLGGWRAHTGIDLAARIGSPIHATSDGQVSRADWFGGYGLFVSLEHGGGVETRYGHMSHLNVLAGQMVHKGDVIGYVGSTGRSTGPHLHYEIRLDGRPINPAAAIRGR